MPSSLKKKAQLSVLLINQKLVDLAFFVHPVFDGVDCSLNAARHTELTQNALHLSLIHI